MVEIGSRKEDERRKVQAFIDKMKVMWHASIGNTIAESQARMKRHKKTILPTREDTVTLHNHLENVLRQSYNDLNKLYSDESYKRIRNSLICYLQLTNCKRAGEVERLFLTIWRVWSSKEMTVDLRSEVKEHSLCP